ncbi:MAG: NADH-quinone oxidoreductase subunit B, partial [Candidatus Kapaibacteriota bacterium]
WARKNSAWPMPLGISCCGIEMMAFASSRFDVSRFGSEVFRMTPRQSDVLIVAGTVTYKMSWVVRKIYDQMPDPKWVISMGVCASTGGMFRSYSVVQGVDQFLPVDVYASGCPPRPENLIMALMAIQDKIGKTRPDLVNFGKNVSPTPIQAPFYSPFAFDPTKKKVIEGKTIEEVKSQIIA